MIRMTWFWIGKLDHHIVLLLQELQCHLHLQMDYKNLQKLRIWRMIGPPSREAGAHLNVPLSVNVVTSIQRARAFVQNFKPSLTY